MLNLFNYRTWTQRNTGLRHYARKASITEPNSERTSLLKHKLWNKTKDHVNNKTIHIISDLDTLLLAYELIKSNKFHCVNTTTRNCMLTNCHRKKLLRM